MLTFKVLGSDILAELIFHCEYLTIKVLFQTCKEINYWLHQDRFKILIEQKRIQHLSQRLQLYIFDFFPRYPLTIRVLSHRYTFNVNNGKFHVTHDYKEESNDCLKSFDESISNTEYLKLFCQRNILNIKTVSFEVPEIIKNIIISNYKEFGDSFLYYCWWPENRYSCEVFLDWEKVLKCYR